MNAITVVEFQTSTFDGQTYVSELADGPPYTVHGVALGDGDITMGQSGIKKLWPSDELKKAAQSLQGTNLVVDHDNSANGVVGRVTKSGYKESVGVIYQAELFDEELAEKVKNGLLEVSIRGYHDDVDVLEEDEETEALIVQNIEFDNLSIVPTGASPSNTLEIGEHDELSAAQLAELARALPTAELEEIEPGMWVTWGDKHGITMSDPEMGDVEVDIYEEVDGTWRAIGETETVPPDELSEWDIEEDDIGSEVSDDEKEENMGRLYAGMEFYSDMNDETLTIVKLGDDMVEMMDEDGDTWYKSKRSVYDRISDGTWTIQHHEVEAGDRYSSTVNGGDVEIVDTSRGQALVQTMDGDSSWWSRISDIREKVKMGEWVSHSAGGGSMSMYSMAPQEDFMFDTEDGAREIVESDEFNVLTGVHSHEIDGKRIWMPGNDMDEFKRWHEMKHAEEMGYPETYTVNPMEKGDYVRWATDEGVQMRGQILSIDETNYGTTLMIQPLRQNKDGSWTEYGTKMPMDIDDVDSWDKEREEESIDIEDLSYASFIEELEEYKRGEWVSWNTRNSTEKGTVYGSYMEGDELPDFRGDRGMSPEGEEVLYALRMYKKRDGTWHPITGGLIGHYEDSIRSVETPSNVSDTPVELGRSNVEQYDVEADQWVQWYPSETTEKHGFATDVSDDEVTIEVWTQLSDGTWKEEGDTVTKSMDEVEPWGNFPREQEDFAIEGEDPRRAVRPSEEENALSDTTKKTLENKVEKHNEEHGDDKGKRVTYRQLESVYNRGGGAYDDSHREGMSRQQWSMARVNAFLYLVRNGNPENDAYVQDNDLLPNGHPKKSEEENQEYYAVDETPEWNDGQLVRWQVEPDLIGRIVHVDEERSIVMVEVHDIVQGELMSTGFTISAGYSDLIPMDVDENAVSTRSVPTQDAEPVHEPIGADDSMASLLVMFMNGYDGDEPSLDDFEAWLIEELSTDAGEFENPLFTSKIERKNGLRREYGDYRYLDSEIAEMAEGKYDDYPKAARENAQMALDAKENTGNPNDCGTSVGWKRARQLANGQALTRTELGKMSAFARHRQNSEMDDEVGRADCGWMMWKAWGGDEGVDWAQMKLDAVEEEAAMADVPSDHKFKTREEAMEKAEEIGLDGVHEMDGLFMPGKTHEEYLDALSEMGMYEGSSTSNSANEGESKSNVDTSDVEELEDYEMHVPSWTGTTERSWSRPDMEDFDTEDMSEIANHFLISSSGFPPENYGDLKLPVVEPNGDLNINALQAVKGGRGVSRVSGLGNDMEEDIVEWVNKTANEEFDRDWGTEEMAYNQDMDDMMDEYMFETREEAMEAGEEMGLEGVHMHGEMYCPGPTHQDLMDAVASMGEHGYGSSDMDEEEEEMTVHSIRGTAGKPTPLTTVGGVRVLPGDDLRLTYSKTEESDADSLTQYKVINMNEEIEAKLSELDQPVAVEAEELTQLQEKADRFEEMSESLDALRERTDILDKVDASQLEELAEADDPVVVESARFEELTEEAEQVKSIYAAALAEEYPAFEAEELLGKFSIEELRAKFEDTIGSVEEELTATSPEPRSQDAAEESLEEAAADPESDEEELTDAVTEKQQELKSKILGGY